VPLESTSYVFSFTTSHQIPARGQLIVVLPTEVTIDYGSFGCSVDLQQAGPSCSQRSSGGATRITLVNLNAVEINAGTTISVTIDGLVNSQFSTETGSFELYTETQDGYSIDQMVSGLTVGNDCDYPCFTCEQESPSECLSCLATSVHNLFWENKCLTACPYGYYEANYQCFQCDEACVSCYGSATNCNLCSGGKYFLKNQCLEECPSEGYFENVE